MDPEVKKWLASEAVEMIGNLKALVPSITEIAMQHGDRRKLFLYLAATGRYRVTYDDLADFDVHGVRIVGVSTGA